MGNKWKLSTSSKTKPSKINKINQGSQIKSSFIQLHFFSSSLSFFFEQYEFAEFAAIEISFSFFKQYEFED